MSPGQELYDRLYIYSEDLHYDTYDQLPKDGTSYPFVVIGDIENMFSNYKTEVGGRVAVTLNVWGTEFMRTDVDYMLEKLTSISTVATEHFKFTNRLNELQNQIISDTSVPNTRLLHGVSTLVFDWTKKGQK
jgi:hypothetical protein